MNKIDNMISAPIIAREMINQYCEMWMLLKKKSLESNNIELLKMIAEIEIENVKKIYNPGTYESAIYFKSKEDNDKIAEEIIKKITDKLKDGARSRYPINW